mmetsp:Transcript_36761/g.98656  ORF Transcript_36761/g.98656 Transcript_36761/m.98656 type:complete len:250 (-) Transcript_36761:585-1334(-)
MPRMFCTHGCIRLRGICGRGNGRPERRLDKREPRAATAQYKRSRADLLPDGHSMDYAARPRVRNVHSLLRDHTVAEDYQLRTRQPRPANGSARVGGCGRGRDRGGDRQVCEHGQGYRGPCTLPVQHHTGRPALFLGGPDSDLSTQLPADQEGAPVLRDRALFPHGCLRALHDLPRHAARGARHRQELRADRQRELAPDYRAAAQAHCTRDLHVAHWLLLALPSLPELFGRDPTLRRPCVLQGLVECDHL